jgi:hypothetical protein
VKVWGPEGGNKIPRENKIRVHFKEIMNVHRNSARNMANLEFVEQNKM